MGEGMGITLNDYVQIIYNQMAMPIYAKTSGDGPDDHLEEDLVDVMKRVNVEEQEQAPKESFTDVLNRVYPQ